jgi:hypothetical protein
MAKGLGFKVIVKEAGRNMSRIANIVKFMVLVLPTYFFFLKMQFSFKLCLMVGCKCKC